MSMIVEVAGREVWEPSLATANVFCAQIATVATLVGRNSGVQGPANDFVYVEPDAFAALLDAAVDRLAQTGSLELEAMLSGVIAVALALEHRITGRWRTLPPELIELARVAQSLR